MYQLCYSKCLTTVIIKNNSYPLRSAAVSVGLGPGCRYSEASGCCRALGVECGTEGTGSGPEVFGSAAPVTGSVPGMSGSGPGVAWSGPEGTGS